MDARPVARARSKETAELAAWARAAGALDPAAHNPDDLAVQLIRRRHRLALVSPVRRLLQRVYERRLPGMYMYVQARTKHFDALVHERAAAGLDQLVILGAGLDTRAYRFREQLAGVRVFEVDFPATAATKRSRLARAGLASDHVTFVGIDLSRDTLAARLPREGFQLAARTLIVWETVTMYLPRHAIDETLAFVGSLGRGSAIAMDYVYARALSEPARFRGARQGIAFAAARGEPFVSGLDPDQLPAVFAPHGLAVATNTGPDELGRMVDTVNGPPIIDWFGIAVAERT
jgi:methyltransferase (TIGR00027 family)